jgi:D-arabinose 1-dehydrogenase-like Zn-dependent alcohol dehydrogenase
VRLRLKLEPEIGKIELQPLPLILGSELSGIVEAIGAEVSKFKLGDEVYGATNEQFSGAYAEYALPSARMMAQKPKTLSFIEAASAPVVTVTAWQMLFDYAHVTASQTYLSMGRRQRWRLRRTTGQPCWPSCSRDRRLRRSGLRPRPGC